jgi:DNA-binding NarL/FixJ family response regulator
VAPSSPRILLVEDDAAFRRRVKELLAEQLPHSTIGEAATGEEALERQAHSAWDAMILDLRLPRRSGLDVLSELRARGSDLAVVVVSMLPENPYAAAVTRAGASAYLTKSRATSELVPTLRRLLRLNDSDPMTSPEP